MDTTGNMNTFGQSLRHKGVTHLYCVDHVLHLNTKHAYIEKHIPDEIEVLLKPTAKAQDFVGGQQLPDDFTCLIFSPSNMVAV